MRFIGLTGLILCLMAGHTAAQNRALACPPANRQKPQESSLNAICHLCKSNWKATADDPGTVHSQ